MLGPIFLLLACSGSKPLDSGTDGGGATDGGGTDGGGDGGTEPTDECDGRPGERFCASASREVRCDDAGDVVAVVDCAEDERCQDERGCLSCALDWEAGLGPKARRAARLALTDGAPPLAPFAELRPLLLSAASTLEGEVRLDFASPEVAAAVALFDERGAALALPLVIDATDLPLRVLAQGRAPFEGPALRAERLDCAEGLATLDLRVEDGDGMAARPLEGFPWRERVRAFAVDETPTVKLDAWRHADLAGRTAPLYRVARREAEAWRADPALVDAGAGPLEASLQGEDGEPAWELPGADWTEEGQRATAWDLVWDLDGDGTLSPGDLYQGPLEDQPAFWAIADLTQPGPHAVRTVGASGGYWLTQRIYYPEDIEALVEDEGARPLVVLSHGNGHDYRWYDYLGEHLASWGFVFMAHSNNTGPGIETASTTTLANTEWLLQNLDSVDDGALLDRIDPRRIAWIGHSRGGEGVTRAYDRLAGGDWSSEAFGPEDIVFISSIAPTVFLGVSQSNPHDRFYHQLDAAADGDVNGGPSSGIVQYLRIAEASTGPLSVHYVQGAAHNDFNCCGFDDGDGPDLIGRGPAQELAMSTYLGLLSWVLLGEEPMGELARRPFGSFRDGGIDPSVIVASQYRPDPAGERLVLDDFQSESATDRSSAGTAVTATVADLVEDRLDDGNSDFTWSSADPMNGMTLASDRDDLSRGAVFSWDAGSESSFRVELPEDARDVRGWTWFSLRACQGSRHPNTVDLDGPLTFGVTLIDGEGQESSILLGDYGQSLTWPYPRRGSGAGFGWANEWNTVRLRVADFAAAGAAVDLSNIVAVELRFGAAWGSEQGRMGLDDLLFSME